MKPTSIVFLVIAVLLILGGVILCITAENIAETDGYVLFNRTEDGSSYRQYDFSGKPVTKISLVVEDAEIYIYGGAEKSYIEFFNFREGLYTFSTSGTIIALDEIPDIESLLDFNTTFSFGGIRQFLVGNKSAGGPRRVNIYLDDLTENLKVIAVDAKNCSVHVDSLDLKCDITVAAEEHLTVTAKDTHTFSALTLTANNLAAMLENDAFDTLIVTAESSDVKASKISFKNLDCKIDTGTADITTFDNIAFYDVEVGAGRGSVRFGGMDRPRPYTQKPTGDAAGTIRIESENADFSITEMAG